MHLYLTLSNQTVLVCFLCVELGHGKHTFTAGAIRHVIKVTFALSYFAYYILPNSYVVISYYFVIENNNQI